MANPHKLILMVQPIRLQGLIWQAVLKSQHISVIWESAEANLAENLDQLKSAGLTLPDLLLLDMRSPNLNPYAFCRWCREQYPGVKVVLTNSGQPAISLAERQWAVNQGASDLFPGFQPENLVSGVAIAVKRILEILDEHPFNNGALISVLLAMKRQLESRNQVLSNLPAASHAANGMDSLQPVSSDRSNSPNRHSPPLNPVSAPSSSTNGKSTLTPNSSHSNGAEPFPANQHSEPSIADKASNGKKSLPETDKSESEPPSSKKQRRYRGLYY